MSSPYVFVCIPIYVPQKPDEAKIAQNERGQAEVGLDRPNSVSGS
jgi:hypothetical protein